MKTIPVDVPEGHKYCWGCLDTHPESAFPLRKRGQMELHSWCRDHIAGRQREWRLENPDRYKEIDFKKRMKTWYHLTVEEYQERLDSQDGRCAICRTDDPGKHNWRVDHDHRCCPQRSRSCGKCIRGLLCGACNTALGLLKESPEVFMRALDYIR